MDKVRDNAVNVEWGSFEQEPLITVEIEDVEKGKLKDKETELKEINV